MAKTDKKKKKNSIPNVKDTTGIDGVTGEGPVAKQTTFIQGNYSTSLEGASKHPIRIPKGLPTTKDGRDGGSRAMTFNLWATMHPEATEDEMAKARAKYGVGDAKFAGSSSEKAHGYAASVDQNLLALNKANEMATEYRKLMDNIKMVAYGNDPKLAKGEGIDERAKGLVGPAPEAPQKRVVDDTLAQIATAAMASIGTAFGALSGGSPSGNEALIGANATQTGMKLIMQMHRDNDKYMLHLYDDYTKMYMSQKKTMASVLDTLSSGVNDYNKAIINVFKQESTNITHTNAERNKFKLGLLKEAGGERKNYTGTAKAIDLEKNKGRNSVAESSRTNATNATRSNIANAGNATKTSIANARIKSSMAIALMKLASTKHSGLRNMFNQAVKLKGINDMHISSNMDAIKLKTQIDYDHSGDANFNSVSKIYKMNVKKILDEVGYSKEEREIVANLMMSGITLDAIVLKDKTLIDSFKEGEHSTLKYDNLGNLVGGGQAFKEMMDTNYSFKDFDKAIMHHKIAKGLFLVRKLEAGMKKAKDDPKEYTRLKKLRDYGKKLLKSNYVKAENSDITVNTGASIILDYKK